MALNILCDVLYSGAQFYHGTFQVNEIWYVMLFSLYFSGLWGSVQLKNHYDIPITFKWDFRKDKVEYSHLYPINQNGKFSDCLQEKIDISFNFSSLL